MAGRRLSPAQPEAGRGAVSIHFCTSCFAVFHLARGTFWLLRAAVSLWCALTGNENVNSKIFKIITKSY